MDKINEMKARKAQIVMESRALLDRVEAEKREFSAEERTSYDKMFADIGAINTKIKDEERLLLAEAEIRGFEKAESGKVETTPEERKISAFRRYLVTGDSAEYRALANDADATGGYLHASEQFVARLIKGLDNAVFVRNYANVMAVTSADSLGVPSLDTDLTDPTWTTEIAAPSEDTTMAFGRRELKPNQLSKGIKVSRKLLLTSALPVEGIIADRLAYKFAITQENGFLNGSGDGQPLGIFTASDNGVPTARDEATGNSASAVSADGLINAKFKLAAQYRKTARWVFHRDIIKMISKLKDGEGQYLWSPGLIAGEPDRLLGLPVDESEYAPSTVQSAAYVGALANWQYYWIAELQGLNVQRLIELYAGTSQIGFFGTYYGDGAPVLSSAFVRVKLG